jgi:hypothetical protein
VFAGFSRQQDHVGPFGNGMKMKAVANMLVAIHNVAAAEAFVFGMKMGLDPASILKVAGNGAGGSRMFEVRGPMMVKDEYPATMKVAVWQKDMQVIGRFAKSLECAVPLFSTSAQVFTAAMAQGMILGAILQGVSVVESVQAGGWAYSGGWLDWLTPFSLLTGISVVAGYALLGATWLIWKLEGTAQGHAVRLARSLGIATLGGMAAVSAATPFLDFAYWERWFEMPGVLLTAQVPILVVIAGVFFFRSLNRGSERLPFAIALGLFLLGFAGLGISLFPYIVPDQITIWDAAAPAASQMFMLVGTVIIVPIILAYTAWSYWVFRGKVGTHGYH